MDVVTLSEDELVYDYKLCPLCTEFHICRKERCAWWDEDRNQCAVLTIAKAEAKKK